MVQAQRRMEAWVHHKPYTKRQEWTPLGTNRSGPAARRDLGRGWPLLPASRDRLEGGAEGGGPGHGRRPAGTRRLYHHAATGEEPVLHHQPQRGAERRWSSRWRPMAEWILPKKRILELYLNVIEWGPGVYGAEAAARTLVRPAGGQGESRTGGAAGCGDPVPVAPQTCPDEHLQRGDSPPHAADGMVRSLRRDAGIMAGDLGCATEGDDGGGSRSTAGDLEYRVAGNGRTENVRGRRADRGAGKSLHHHRDGRCL